MLVWEASAESPYETYDDLKKIVICKLNKKNTH